MWSSLPEYASKVWSTWWALMLGVVFGIVGAMRELGALPGSIRLPTWLWLLLALICFSLAQFRAFHEVRVQRDEGLAERDQGRRPTIPLEPHWMSLDDYQRRVKELEGEWQIQLPTPEGAQRWLREGWERDEIDRHPVEVGGRLRSPEHWPVRRRPPGYGLSKAAQRLLVASYRSTQHPARIFRLDAGGTVIVQAGTLRKHGLEWRLALDELVEGGYAKRWTEAMYELTGAGVEAATVIAPMLPEADPKREPSD